MGKRHAEGKLRVSDSFTQTLTIHLARGSEYPNSRVLGPKIHALNGFGALKPYYLGTWILRVRVQGLRFRALGVRGLVFSV